MKRSLIAFLTWVVAIGAMLVAGTAFGAATKSIKITITKDFGATITADKGCTLSSGEPLPAIVTGPDDMHASELQWLLSEGGLCDKKPVTAQIDIEDNAVFSSPVQPREYRWLFSRWNWVEDAAFRLGLPESCDAAESGQPVPTDGRSCKVARAGDGLVFDLTTPFDKGQIVVTYKLGGKAKHLKIPVYPCEFDVTGPILGLVAGASEQLLELGLSDASYACRIPPGVGMLTDAGGARSMPARVEAGSGPVQRVTLTDIPSELSGGVQSFKLKMAGGLVAVVRAAVIPAVAVGKLTVRYQVQKDLDIYRQLALAGGDAATTSSGDRYAVVSSQIDGKDMVVNTAALTWPSALPTQVIDCAGKREHQLVLGKIEPLTTMIDDNNRQLKVLAKQIDELEDALRELNAAAPGRSRAPAPRHGLPAAGPVPPPAPTPPGPSAAPPSTTASTVSGTPSAVAPPKPTVESVSKELADARKKVSELTQANNDANRKKSALTSKPTSYFTWRIDRQGEGGFRPLVVDPSVAACPPEPPAPTTGDALNSPPAQSSEDAASAPEDRPVPDSFDLHQIPFVADRPISGPVSVALILRQDTKPAGSAEASPQRSVLKIVLALATKARAESIPLPVRDFLEVRCTGEDVGFWNGEVHAIGEGAVHEGQCQLQEKQPTEQWSAGMRERLEALRKVLPLYGPQTLNVIVRRGGVEWKQLWKFAPVTATASAQWPRTVTLEEPQADSKTDEYYTIEVRPVATQNIAVEYRNSTLASIAEASIATPGELMFTSRLRTRGTFALPWVLAGGGRDSDGRYQKPLSLRTYLSATVLASGFRFPASTIDLKSSTSNKDAQYVSPVIGALWTIEPWSYDRGQNPWPLNPVLQFGAHFYTLGNEDVGFNPLVGAGLTLPLVKENTPTGSQLGTQATVGLFFEWDTREARPHALLGLSVNVGSLLSGK